MIVENTDGKSVRGLQDLLRNISYYIEDIDSVIPIVRKQKISRGVGAAMVIAYIVYTAYIIMR